MTTTRLVATALAGLIAAALCTGQTPVPVVEREVVPTSPSPLPGEEVMRPTELGLRLTPEFARAIGRKIAGEGPFGRYGLDEEARAKVGERIARRLMALAHDNQSEGRAFIEWALPTLFETEGEFAPEVGKQWSEYFAPLLPKFRRTVLDVIEDVRPLVPPDKQLAYARDMIGVTLYFDAMIVKMDRWAEGGATGRENPFETRQERQNVERERQRQEQHATDYAEDRVAMLTSKWPDYVQGAIEFYDFDETQQQAARSVLKEIQERAAQIMTKDWKDKARANRRRLWLGLQVDRRHPSVWPLKFEWQERVAPIEQLERELSSRLDRIATQRQRAAAKQHLEKKIRD